MLSRNQGALGSRASRLATEAMNIARRVNHGGSTWRFRGRELRQPQDGAVDEAPAAKEVQTRMGPVLISEPEDAGLTGNTRSLTRRLLGLNIGRDARGDHPAPAPMPLQVQKIPNVSAGAKSGRIVSAA